MGPEAGAAQVALNLDAESRAALALAKRTVPAGGELDARALIAAFYHGTSLRERWPGLHARVPEPKPLCDEAPEKLPVEQGLRPVLGRLALRGEPVTAEAFLHAVCASEPGQSALAAFGIEATARAELLRSLQGERPEGAPGAPGSWRGSQERRRALEALAAYGRTLTAIDLPSRAMAEMEGPIAALLRTLAKRRRRNAILVGPPGTGKSAVIYELARRLRAGDPSIPASLRDLDLFELSPSFLRAGASVVGEYEARIKALLEVLTSHPKIVLFVDEIHALLQSSIHGRTPFSDANESFKSVLGRGEITCLGATTPAEYRHFIEPDGPLARRFKVIRLEPPAHAAMLRILAARRPDTEAYYHPLRIPDAMLARTIALSDAYLPSRFQPDKSIQLLDDACAWCVTQSPPLPELTEAALWAAIEDGIGRSIVRSEALTEETVLMRLHERIIGQEQALRGIARALVAGLGGWGIGSRPRGAFFFCGPTGVGKTEAALRLADILGGGRDALVTVNCNLLQSAGHDAGPVTNILLGAPPGFIGYARGQGGLLSQVRERPESVVLFDEIEKADPSVGKLLLQILDDGKIEDADGSVLDFRRAFIVFTTNAGCAYGARLGFGAGGRDVPRGDVESVRADLRSLGLGEEFLGRISHWFVFESLDGAEIREVIRRQLEKLHGAADTRGFALEWEPAVVEHLAIAWEPRFGVRHLLAILRHRSNEHLSGADGQGELRGGERVRLAVAPPGRGPDGAAAGLRPSGRAGATLVLELG